MRKTFSRLSLVLNKCKKCKYGYISSSVKHPYLIPSYVKLEHSSYCYLPEQLTPSVQIQDVVAPLLSNADVLAMFSKLEQFYGKEVPAPLLKACQSDLLTMQVPTLFFSSE